MLLGLLGEVVTPVYQVEWGKYDGEEDSEIK